MAILLKLHPNGRALLAETEHGASIALPRDPAEWGPALLALLQKQREPKRIAPGVDGDVLVLCLAEWERIGRPGDGRGLRRAQRAGSVASVRIFTPNGKELLPL